jgi:8-oxo-dGTP diphosphatase
MKKIYLASPIIVKEDKDENERVLLVKRAKEPYKGNWQLPGGKIEHEEKAEEAAIREVKEETDLEFKNLKFIKEYDHYYPNLNCHYFYKAFIGEVGEENETIEDINKRIKLEQKEATEFKWASKEDIKEMKLQWGAKLISYDYFKIEL